MHQVMEDGWKQIMDALVETGSHRRLQNRVNTYYRFSEFMFTAPVLFAVGAADTGPTLAQRLRTAGVDKEEHGRQRDVDITVGMAVNTMILKGEELGLGSCILTMPLFFMNHAESKSTETILKMEDMTVRCFVTVGYPDEIPAEIDRKEFFEIYREL